MRQIVEQVYVIEVHCLGTRYQEVLHYRGHSVEGSKSTSPEDRVWEIMAHGFWRDSDQGTLFVPPHSIKCIWFREEPGERAA